jgi:hypothetical protein
VFGYWLPQCPTKLCCCAVLWLQAKPIADMFPHASDDALDLLTKLLQVGRSRTTSLHFACSSCVGGAGTNHHLTGT